MGVLQELGPRQKVSPIGLASQLAPRQPLGINNGQCLLLEKGVATHSSILAWRIPRTEEPGGLQSMESQRVGCDQVINTQAGIMNGQLVLKRLEL